MVKKILITLVFAFLALFFATSADAATLYLSPGSAKIPQGSVVSVAVGLNTKGESVNAISAYLNYPSDKLEVAWISYGGSFSIAAEGSYGGGGIRISRGSISGVVGSVNVATIGFRGKAQGAATVSFIGGSGAARTSDSSDSLNLGGSTGGTFTIIAPVPGGQGGVTAATTDKNQKVPVISNVDVSLISTVAATISWTTDKQTDSQVEYGLESGKYFLSLSNQALVTDHVIKVEGPALTPGALFHFRIKAKDAAGNEGVSDDKIFQLKGYTVTIKILDTNNMPIPNTEVILYSEPNKSQTSLNGEVVFENVTAGKHLVVIKVSNSLNKAGEVNIKDVPLEQNFTLVVNTKLGNTDYLYLTLAIIGLVGIIALGVGIFLLKRKKRLLTDNNPQQPA